MTEIPHVKHPRREQSIHEVYMFSIALKGVGALLETLLGLMLLYTRDVVSFILDLINNEFLDDPNDFLATHFKHAFNPSPETQVFGGLYLLSHGVVKLFLIIGLWRGKLWAYPASLAVFMLFILYQLVRFARTHSGWLLALTVLDLIVMWLIWHEYRRVQKEIASKA